MAKLHTHPCEFAPQGCQTVIDCLGDLERNHDGYPEVVCSLYHAPNGSIMPDRCAECEESYCTACGQVTRFEGHAERCSQHPENIEPPDTLDYVTFPYAANH